MDHNAEFVTVRNIRATIPQQGEESDTVFLCGICGYTTHDCIGHQNLRPDLRGRNRLRPVRRLGEEHKHALKTYAEQFAFWEKKEANEAKARKRYGI